MTENIPAAFAAPSPTEGATIAQILAKARPAERTVRICLRADLLARRDQLEAQIGEAAALERSQVREGMELERTLSEADPLEDLREELRTVLGEMRESYQPFTFRALPRSVWDALRKKFEDAGGKLDMDGLAVPIIAASSVAPAMTEAEVTQLFEVLNNDQRNDLFNGAWAANTGAVDVPFSPASLAARTPRGRASS